MKLFIFLFFSFIYINSDAQKKNLPAYIINLNGDTIKGEIVYYDLSQSPELVRFKPADGDLFRVYGKEDILGFGIESVSDFVSDSVLVDISPFRAEDLTYDNKIVTKSARIFLKRIREGSLSLFSYFDGTDKYHFFISVNDSTPVELINRRYLVKGDHGNVIQKQEKYRNQLAYYMSDCNDIQNRISKLKYTEESLLDLFDFYSKCKGEINAKTQSSSKTKVKIGAFGGINIHSIKFESDLNYYNITNADFSKDLSFIAGLRIIFPIQNKFDRHEIVTNIGYNSLHTTSETTQKTTTLLGEETKQFSYLIKYYSIKTDVCYLYKITNNAKAGIFIYAGLSMEFIFSKEYSFHLIESYPNSVYSDSTGDIFGDEERNNQQFIFAGAGINIQKTFSITADYERGNGFLDFANLQAKTEGIKIILCYIF